MAWTSPPTSSDDRWLARLLSRLVDLAQRRAGLTVAVTLALTAVLGVYASRTIGFNADPKLALLCGPPLSASDPHVLALLPGPHQLAADRGGGRNARADARGGGDAPRRRLPTTRTFFTEPSSPGEDQFFERHGLLYGTVEEVDDFADHMALLQPVLGQLAADLSLPTLASVRRDRARAQGREPTLTRRAGRWWLGHLRSATDAAREGDTAALSWERVLITGSGFEPIDPESARRGSDPRLPERARSRARDRCGARDGASRGAGARERRGGSRYRISGAQLRGDDGTRARHGGGRRAVLRPGDPPPVAGVPFRSAGPRGGADTDRRPDLGGGPSRRSRWGELNPASITFGRAGHRPGDRLHDPPRHAFRRRGESG